jgi:hypothetical protein
MSEGPKTPLDFYICWVERHLRRPITAEERSCLEKAELDIPREIAALRELSKGPIEKRFDAVVFKKKLKARQGTIMPDFEVLYKKKADIERQLFQRDP